MSKELVVALGESGLTVTANVYLAGVLKTAGISCPEIGATGMYAGDFSATPNVAGVYEVAFFAGSETVARAGAQCVWDGSAEVQQTGDAFARIGAAGAGLTALGDGRLVHLDADVSSRSTFAGGPVASVTGPVASVTGAVGSVTGLTASDVAAIKAKTDNLPTDPADASDIAASFGTVNTSLATIAGYIDTEVAAIKAKTDNLPAAPAAVGDIPTAAQVADAVWDETAAGHQTVGSTGKALTDASALGAGAIPWTYTLTRSDNAAPIAGASVWVTSDLAGSNVIASGQTDAAGQITFYLSAGDAYFWRAKAGFNFVNPDVETVS